jgi:hypothetical protein
MLARVLLSSGHAYCGAHRNMNTIMRVEEAQFDNDAMDICISSSVEQLYNVIEHSQNQAEEYGRSAVEVCPEDTVFN